MPNVRLSFALTEDMKDSLEKIAIKENITTSELIRKYINQGMSIDKTTDDIDFIRRNIREEIDSAMKPKMNRIIKLLVKIGTMTVTMCYFTSHILHAYVLRDKTRLTYNEFFDKSKRKSAAFLGIRDEAIDDLTKALLDLDDDEDEDIFN